jgi:V/A-type H+-transporting ATPase subunit I
MIVKMNKYSFVVLSSKRDEFLSRLQELGLVDVTTSGWEPSETDRRVMIELDQYKAAVAKLGAMADQPQYQGGKPFENGDEAFDRYCAAEQAVANLEGEKARLQKVADEVRPWGEFDASMIERLRSEGVVLHFFAAQSSDYERHIDQWRTQYVVEPVNDVNGTWYFVVVTGPDAEVMIDAQELKLPTMPLSAVEAEMERLDEEIRSWDKVYAACVASVDVLEKSRQIIASQLDFDRVARSGKSEADGALTLMEAWAEVDNEAAVDAMLDAEPGLYYIKEKPTPEDNTPVKLKNGWFSRAFELIGAMYALPK